MTSCGGGEAGRRGLRIRLHHQCQPRVLLPPREDDPHERSRSGRLRSVDEIVIWIGEGVSAPGEE